jgi:protein-tyrosine phosphatase
VAAQVRVLAVCTANICRSPVAERVLRRHLSAAGWDVTVRSAGTHGGRLPVHRDTLAAAAGAGIDLSDHVSRALDRSLLHEDGADLVVAMTREHLRDVVALDPTVWGRTFTLKELVRRAGDVPAGSVDLATWRAALGDGRRAADLMRPNPADDVADPFGGPASGHAAMVRDLDDLAARLARLVPRGMA